MTPEPDAVEEVTVWQAMGQLEADFAEAKVWNLKLSELFEAIPQTSATRHAMEAGR